MNKRLMVFLSAVVAILFVAPSAGASTITVDTVVDSFGEPGECSLRSAVYAADKNVATGGCPAGDSTPNGVRPSRRDTVLLPGGEYRLTLTGAGEDAGKTGDLDATSDGSIALKPSGRDEVVTIDGVGSDRIFDTSARFFSVERLTLAGGRAGGLGAEEGGGAIRLNGGSVFMVGVLVVTNESASDGGGILQLGGAMNFVNSTIAKNSADGSGGGYAIANGVLGGASLRGVTIAENEADADSDGNGQGGGVRLAGLGSGVANSLIADNVDGSPLPGDRAPDCSAAPGSFVPRFVMSTQDLVGSACQAPPNSKFVTSFSPVDPMLGPLADNGGPTFTYAIPASSPAAGANPTMNDDNSFNNCTTRDQRGVPRALGKCDLGAFQVNEGLPGIRAAAGRKALFDGKGLYLIARCPARLKPNCRIRVSALSGGRKSRTAGSSKLVKIPSGKSKRISVKIKPKYRRPFAGLTSPPGRKVLVKQAIKSKRVGRRKARRAKITFVLYKVRSYDGEV